MSATFDMDLLLAWMTHLGQGSWPRFQGAVREISRADGEDLDGICRSMRAQLSDMGHVDFFLGRRWLVREPVLVGLAQGGALLVGGRTPAMTAALCAGASSHQCVVSVRVHSPYLPALVAVAGRSEDIASLAAAVRVRYVAAAASRFLLALRPISELLGSAQVAPDLVNWSVRSWSFAAMAWVEGREDRTALEYTNRFGARQHAVDLGRQGLRAMGRREAVFTAAWLREARILVYNSTAGALRAPRRCPLPEPYARAACLAGGVPPRLDGDHVVYEEVPPNVARGLLLRLGQPLGAARAGDA